MTDTHTARERAEGFFAAMASEPDPSSTWTTHEAYLRFAPMAKDVLAIVARVEELEAALREIATYSCYGTAWNAYVDVKRIAHAALSVSTAEEDTNT